MNEKAKKEETKVVKQRRNPTAIYKFATKTKRRMNSNNYIKQKEKHRSTCYESNWFRLFKMKCAQTTVKKNNDQRQAIEQCLKSNVCR